VNYLVDRTVLLLSQQPRDKAIGIKLKMLDDDLAILADKKMMQQVLWNIALNGIQAMGDSGTLTLLTSRDDGSVKIEIRDTGKGIPAEALCHVFEPFFTTKHKGTGLGLAIAKRIIEQHGGTIRLVSEVGKGTAVSILIPMRNKGR
jgi:signal transduction histidine kinase